MIQSVRYQRGHLYEDHGAWFVRFRLGTRQADGSVKMQRTAERLGSVEDFATKADVEAVRMAFMQKVNGAQTNPHPSMTLSEFSEQFYLPWVERELRASTYKGYRDIWNLYLSGRVGEIRLRRFRTVDASRMLRAVADDCDLTKTTLQHIKSVLSGIFTHAKNEGAYDGENPVEGARIPRNAREPGETYAYNLVQILRILEVLPLLPKAAVATASFAGLREGELRGVEWPDFAGETLTVRRSVWKAVVNAAQDSRQPSVRSGDSKLGRDLGRLPRIHAQPANWINLQLRQRGVHGHGQACPARDPSGSRGQRLAVVWLARFPARHCVQPVRVGCQ